MERCEKQQHLRGERKRMSKSTRQRETKSISVRGAKTWCHTATCGRKLRASERCSLLQCFIILAWITSVYSTVSHVRISWPKSFMLFGSKRHLTGNFWPLVFHFTVYLKTLHRLKPGLGFWAFLWVTRYLFPYASLCLYFFIQYLYHGNLSVATNYTTQSVLHHYFSTVK